jgi:drug/metabolite transporter (DMT)-like permease
VLFPIMFFADRPWTLAWPSLKAIGALAGLALLSTALAYILYFRILATAGATNLLLVTFLIPVRAIALGILMLGETAEARHILGMALIGTGLAAVDGRPWRAIRQWAAPAPT